MLQVNHLLTGSADTTFRCMAYVSTTKYSYTILCRKDITYLCPVRPSHALTRSSSESLHVQCTVGYNETCTTVLNALRRGSHNVHNLIYPNSQWIRNKACEKHSTHNQVYCTYCISLNLLSTHTLKSTYIW